MLLRDHLAWLQDAESYPITGFSMGSYFTYIPKADVSIHHCGTSACMAGHAILLSGEGKSAVRSWDSVTCFDYARDWLGLTNIEAKHLFYGHFNPNCNLDSISLEQAIKQLDHMIKTGEI